MQCPRCSSNDVKKDGNKLLKGIKYPVAKCNSCGYKNTIDKFGGPDASPSPINPGKRALWNQRISASKMGQGKGKIIPQEMRNRISKALVGIPKSDITKQRMSESHMGKTPGNKGMSYSINKTGD